MKKVLAIRVLRCYTIQAFAWTWEVAGTLRGVVRKCENPREFPLSESVYEQR